MDRIKWIQVTDAADIEALLARKGELDTPEFYMPNGHLWVVAEEYRLWRAMREPQSPTS